MIIYDITKVMYNVKFPEACSWRKDSRRCYPGTCADETVGSCKCLNGFGGRHCETSKICCFVAPLKNIKLKKNLTKNFLN